MIFTFSRQGLSGRDRALERWFEILPGATSWSILLGMLCLAWWRPLVAAVLVIAFDLYWLLRLFYMTLFLVISYARLSAERETDWMARVRDLDRLQAGGWPSASPHGAGWRQGLSGWIHRRTLDAVQRRKVPWPRSSEVYHLVIISILKEGTAVIGPGIERLAQQPFPASHVVVVLALEERATAQVQAEVQAMVAAYRDRFLELLLVVHPDGLPGEAQVKGANITYAAKAAAASLARRGIPFERVVVSCCDADTIVSDQYLAALTYAFMTCPDRTRASFQPIPVYHNNIWDVPWFARVLDIGASFFQLIEATNPEKLVTFSSHSMSFQALVEVGYWPVDMISDDSAIFWKAFIHFDGRYRVVPMYVTLSMDVAASDSWWKTMTNVYRQKRRWAWGVENFPIVMRAFLRADRIGRWQRLRHAFKLFEGHVAWATWAFILTVIGWVPALCAGREFSSTVLYYSAPRITGTIFSLASLVLLTTIVLSLCLLPRPTGRHAFWRRLSHTVEWLLVPLASVVLSALPALDAQTRLMCGRSLGFWVTDKRRRATPGWPRRTDAAIVGLRKSAYDEPTA